MTKDEDRVLRGGGYTDRPMKVGWLSEMVQGSPLSAETADTQSDRYCGACPVWMADIVLYLSSLRNSDWRR